MARIVILDADPALGSWAVTGGRSPDLDLQPLLSLGEVSIYEQTNPEQLDARISEADVVLTNKVALDRSAFARHPGLRLVSVLATGVNVIDLPAAKQHGVTVCNVPGYSTASTAQHAFALLLEICHRVGAHSEEVRAGGWASSPTFSFFRQPLIELDGKTLGIVGFGSIGARMASLGQAFGMDVLAHSRSPKVALGVRFVGKQELLEHSDVVSLHCPLTEETKHFIDEAALSAMKPSGILINCSRGPVVDELALHRALCQGDILAAGLDVLDREPPFSDSPLVANPRAVITPHIAWATRAARRRLLAATCENVRAFLAGRPQNLVT